MARHRSIKVMALGYMCMPCCCALRCRRAVLGNEATKQPIMLAKRARKALFVRSSRAVNDILKVGSWGNGASGWMYVKKSSMSSVSTGHGAIDSASTANGASWPPAIEMSVSAALCGVGLMFGSSRCCLAAFAASACLFGGPRRFMERLNVQSTPNSWQALHGCVSSHCG